MTYYGCPNCGESSPDNFRAHYIATYTEKRDYPLNLSGDPSDVDEDDPGGDTCEEANYGECDTISEEFDYYCCEACGHHFTSFDEKEEDDEDDEDDEDGEDDSDDDADDDDETLPGYLIKCNTDSLTEVRKALNLALADEELTLPSALVSATRQALDSYASLEQLVNQLNRIRRKDD